MKNYNSMTDTYLKGSGLKRIHVRNEVGIYVLHQVTDDQIKDFKRKGIQIRVPVE